MASRIQRELALLLTGKDVSWSKTVSKAEKTTARLHKVGAKAGANMARNLERGVIVGAAAATTAVGFAIKQATDLESSSASVAKTVGKGWEQVVEANKKLASTSPVDVNALNEISAAAGAMGVSASGIDEFTKTVALLAETADDVSTEAGAQFLGTLRTNMKLTDAQLLQTGDLVTHLGNNSNATEGDILAMAENVSGAAGFINASIGDVMAWSAAMAGAGEEAEAGGSAIQRVWISSAKFVAEGGKELKLLAKISGQSVGEFQKSYGKDAPKTLAKFIVKLGKLSKAEQLATLEALGWDDIRITRAMGKMLANTDNLTGAYRELGSAEGAMQREAEIRFATTAAQLDILRNNANLAAASIGSKLLPVVNELAGEAITWLQDHEGDVERFGDELAVGVRDAVRWAKSLDWELIGSSLRTAGMGAKAVVDAFAGMPPWIQQAVLTGWGLNKLTGGAVVDLGKIAIDQFAGRGSSPAHPVFVSQVGGLPGAAGGAAGAAGWAQSIKPFLAILGPAIAAAVVVDAVTNETNAQMGTNFVAPAAGAGGIIAALHNLGEVIKLWDQKLGDPTDRGHEAGGRTRGPTQGPQFGGADPDKRQWRNDKLEAAAEKTNAQVDRLRLSIGDDLGNHKTSTKAAIRAAAIETGLAAQRAGEKSATASRTAGITSGVAARLAGEKAAAASRTAGIVAKAGGLAAASAIRDKNLSIKNTINVSARLSTRDAAASITAYSIATGVAAKNR